MQLPMVLSRYQLAFLTPGMFPSRAFILKGYYTKDQLRLPPSLSSRRTYPCHSEILENTPGLSTLYTPIVYLRKPRVAVHLR